MFVTDQTYSPSRLPASRNASCSSTYLGLTPTSILHLGWLFPTSKTCIHLWVFDLISHSLLWLRDPSWFLHLPSVTFSLSTVNRLFSFSLVIFYSECPYPWSGRAFASLHLSAPDSHPMGILLTGGSQPLNQRLSAKTSNVQTCNVSLSQAIHPEVRPKRRISLSQMWKDGYSRLTYS